MIAPCSAASLDPAMSPDHPLETTEARALSRTYSALLTGDHLEWIGEPPGSVEPVLVTVVIAPPTVSFTELPAGVRTLPVQTPEARARGIEALKRIAARGTFAPEITDVVAWQREVRRDRPLPGREA